MVALILLSSVFLLSSEGAYGAKINHSKAIIDLLVIGDYILSIAKDHQFMLWDIEKEAEP